MSVFLSLAKRFPGLIILLLLFLPAAVSAFQDSHAVAEDVVLEEGEFNPSEVILHHVMDESDGRKERIDGGEALARQPGASEPSKSVVPEVIQPKKVLKYSLHTTFMTSITMR